MGNTKDFFKEKKDWSKLKDRIIDNYLTPYIAKICYTYKPTWIIDCYAGKGKFDDDSIGSPLIIAKHIQNVLSNQAYHYKNINAIFIEKKYYKDLKQNVNNFKNCKVLQGTFEENVDSINSLDVKSNIFIYADPYGIKSLDFNLFKKIKDKNFHSLELLMNFNSFGFLREGCRLLKCKCDICLEETEEMEYELDDANTIDNMNNIANGDYWQNILNKYNSGEIDMRTAEELFCKEYTNQIKRLFIYSVDIPIKTKANNIPKYRLIFGTNHPDGLLLMSDEMNKAWAKLLETERMGQPLLFEYEYPEFSLRDKIINDEDIAKDIISKCEKNHDIDYKDLIVLLIGKYGISFPQKKYNAILKSLENTQLEIIRIDKKSNAVAVSKAFDTKKFNIKCRIKI